MNNIISTNNNSAYSINKSGQKTCSGKLLKTTLKVFKIARTYFLFFNNFFWNFSKNIKHL